jgi:anti-anti-sigma factor
MPEVTRPSEFRFAVRQDRERVVIRMHGELDVGSPDVVVVEELLDVGFGHVATDHLREAEFMDFAGVRMLISASRSAERRRSAVSVVGGPANVHRVLELTAADSSLGFVSDGANR